LTAGQKQVYCLNKKLSEIPQELTEQNAVVAYQKGQINELTCQLLKAAPHSTSVLTLKSISMPVTLNLSLSQPQAACKVPSEHLSKCLLNSDCFKED